MPLIFLMFACSSRSTPVLTSLQHNLEFELRLQQYIEMVRTQDPSKKIEAINHARKYLVSNQDPDSKEIQRAAGMLVFAQDTRAEPYKVQLSNRPKVI